jgi:hypothetical protein
MKKILLLSLIILQGLNLLAQTGNIRITNYGIYSVGTPHFALTDDSVFMTFDTNFPYMEFPISGPAVPYTINTVIKPPQFFAPVHAEVGVIGKYKSVAYIDWSSATQKYHCYETHSEDQGQNWSVPQILDTSSIGSSIPINNRNPLIKNTLSSFYYLSQSFLDPHYGMLKITKASPPSFVPTDVIFPLDTALGIDAEPFDYEVAGDGSTTRHALAYFNEGEDKLYFVKSSDDGNIFSAPSEVWRADTSVYHFTNPLNLDMSMDANGNVVIAFTIFLEEANFNASDRLFVAISKDFGKTWTVDSIPGLSVWGVSNPMTGFRSNGQQVIVFQENGYIKTLSTDHLKSFSAIDTLTEMGSAIGYHAIVKNDFLYAAWEDNRFGFGLEEIYYDTIFTQLAPPPTRLPEKNKFVSDMSISPNPFTTHTSLDIEGDPDEKFDISIIDMRGRICRKYEKFPVGRLNIDRYELNAGIYIVSISDSHQRMKNVRMCVVD